MRAKDFLYIFQLSLCLKTNRTFCLVGHLKKILEFSTPIENFASAAAKCQPLEISLRHVTTARKSMSSEVMSATSKAN